MHWRAFGLVACLGVACRSTPGSEPRPAPSAAPSPDTAAAIDSVLAAVHAKISLAAPPWQLQPLACDEQLLAAVTEDGVRAFSLPDATLLFEAPLEAPRGIVATAAHALVVAGAEATLELEPHAKKPLRLPAIPWLPGTLLLPERREPGFVWSVQTSGRLFVRQRLDRDPLHALDQAITLDGYAGGPVAVLRDGALLFAASDGVRRSLPEGRPRSFKPDLEVWRLLPGRRVDQAWALAPDGTVELWFIGERLLVQKRFVAGALPYDAAASSSYLALVVVEEPSGAPRRFRLVVFDNDGKRVLERALPPGPPEVGEDWAAQAGANRHVTVCEGEPFVAVGGPGALEVFRLSDGALVLTR